MVIKILENKGQFEETTTQVNSGMAFRKKVAFVL